jgi:Bor protein
VRYTIPIVCRLGRAVVAAGFVVAVAGCHTMRFELVNEPAAHVVAEHKSYFLWGLAPTVDVNVLDKCPNGAAAIWERTTFADGLMSLPTLGIWSPRSTKYYCRGPQSANAAEPRSGR